MHRFGSRRTLVDHPQWRLASHSTKERDGLITLTSNRAFKGNAFVIENGQDIEFFSSNNFGAINGQGYIARLTSSGQNARLVRFITCTDVSMHNIILVDSPTFHIVLNGVSNFELYYITVRGKKFLLNLHRTQPSPNIPEYD